MKKTPSGKLSPALSSVILAVLLVLVGKLVVIRECGESCEGIKFERRGKDKSREVEEICTRYIDRWSVTVRSFRDGNLSNAGHPPGNPAPQPLLPSPNCPCCLPAVCPFGEQSEGRREVHTIVDGIGARGVGDEVSEALWAFDRSAGDAAQVEPALATFSLRCAVFGVEGRGDLDS